MTSIRGERNTPVWEKVIRERDYSKKQHCKLEVIFTASRNKATKDNKLNYKTKGLG